MLAEIPVPTIAHLQQVIHQTNVEKGWWPEEEKQTRNVPEALLLMAEEIIEAFAEYRNNKSVQEIYFNGEKPEGIPIELADCVIRILDFCEGFGINLEAALLMKMEYNKTRPYKHGGKKC